MDIRRGSPHLGQFGANDAIPGLDIDPPEMDIGPDGKPRPKSRGRSENNGEGLGGWIGRMVSRTRNDDRSRSTRGQYGRIGQDDD